MVMELVMAMGVTVVVTVDFMAAATETFLVFTEEVDSCLRKI